MTFDPSLSDFMPEEPLDGFVAHAGAPRDPGETARADESAMIDAMRMVYDPEIPVNIYDLGLIYDIKVEDNGNTHITMTVTAPGCPVAGILPQQVADAVAGVAGTGLISVELVWDPPWEMSRMSEDARLALDMF